MPFIQFIDWLRSSILLIETPMEPIPSHQLEAFVAVAETQHFTRAASRLHITQSALSQRIMNLEELLETSLIVRDPRKVRLTPAGDRLLRYARLKQSLEEETLEELLASQRRSTGLRGTLRIGGFSTILRSKILPALQPLLKSNPDIQLELRVAELRDLPALLRSGEADLILTNERIDAEGIESILVFREENVLVESKNLAASRGNTVFDHDPEDKTTELFIKLQSKRFLESASLSRPRRSYLDEIYSILDAVELGLGRAVVPRHLLRAGMKELPGQNALEIPVYLQRLVASYRPKVLEQAWNALTQLVPGSRS